MEAESLIPHENISLVQENIQFAKAVARKFHRERNYLDIDLEDFIGAALLGLCDAASRYDREVSENFRTYSYFRIRGAMFDLVRKHPSVVSNTEDRSDSRNVSKTGNIAITAAPSKPSESCNMESIVDDLGLLVYMSKDGKSSEVAYAYDLTPEEQVASYDKKKQLRRVLRRLPVNQQKVIELRYYQDLTFDEISNEMEGKSKSWISRLHTKAMDNLRSNVLEQRSYNEWC